PGDPGGADLRRRRERRQRPRGGGRAAGPAEVPVVGHGRLPRAEVVLLEELAALVAVDDRTSHGSPESRAQPLARLLVLLQFIPISWTRITLRAVPKKGVDGPRPSGYGFPSMAPKRHGITAGGTWIVDRVKTIDAYPREDHLATILSETRGGGGGAHNVILDLALMEAPFPLRGQGVVGTDEDGKWLIQEAYKLGIDVGGMRTTKEQATSYTDVYVVRSTGRRTFFH